MEVQIKLEKVGWFWGWTILNTGFPVHVYATDLIPRLSEKSARKAAERAARHIREDEVYKRQYNYTVGGK